MHVATVSKWVEYAGATLEPGRYWLEDHNAAELLWHGRGFGDVALKSERNPEYIPGRLRPGGSLLVVRVGGFGDLLWLNAIYAPLRAFGIHIAHACFPRYAEVLEGFVDEVIPYPLRAEDAARFDCVAWMENIIEGKPCVDGEHPCERMAKFLEVPAPSRLAAYRLDDEEVIWARGQFPRTDRKRVAVQVASSTGSKSYPHLLKAMAMLHTEGVELVLVGEQRLHEEKLPVRVYDCTQGNHSMRQSIAMVATCDAVLGADSVMIHAAHALDIPAVGVFGPFEGRSYMKGYRGRWLQGRLGCSPCSWHPRGTAFPPAGPCAGGRVCCALDKLQPEEVVRQVMKQLS